MRIAITGASGFIGQPLLHHLRGAGHDVLTIGRARASGRGPDIQWSPAAGTIDAVRLEGLDAVIHLAGEPIAQRWSPEVKRAIRESRVQGTGLIARTLAALSSPPAVLVSMSAVGIYGDRGDEVLDESAAPARDFLGEVAQAWEGAADPARTAGIRVVHPRLGIALHRNGGALGKMVPIFSLGAGGVIGEGRQWMSWISRTDVLRALAFMVGTPSARGPMNLVAPSPVQNREFTQALAHALHRPAFAPVPALAIRLLYGEMGAATVLSGQRAVPKALLEAGFQFAHPDLASALADALRPVQDTVSAP